MKNTASIMTSGRRLPRTRTQPGAVPAAMRAEPASPAASATPPAASAHAASVHPPRPNFVFMSCSDSTSITPGMMTS